MKVFNAMMRVVAVCVLMGLAGAAAAQQAYPNRPVRLISPNAPGGSTTLLGRIIAQKLTERLGQQVILENRAGGNGFIAGEAVAKSPPDGYTLLIITNTHLITPLLIPAPYDTVKDFAPVGQFARNETILVVHPSVPANSLQEFIALAKSKPGQLNYASSGGGSPLHLSTVLFERMTGVTMQHIPYKGGGPGVIDLIGGQVQLSFQTPIAVTGHVKAGRLKALAITGKQRSPGLPQVPIFIEAGLPGFDGISSAQGIIAPVGTPREIINKLAAEIANVVAMPDTKEKLIDQGAEPFTSTPEQFAATIKTDIARFAKLIKEANIKID